MKKVMLLLLILVFVSSCVTEEINNYDTEDFESEEIVSESETSDEGLAILEEALGDSEEVNEILVVDFEESEEVNEILSAPAIDEGITIEASVSPDTLDVYDKITIIITAESSVGVDKLYFESNMIFWDHEKIGEFDCGSEESCTNTWELTAYEPEMHEIIMYAIDSDGQESEKVVRELDVQPYVYVEPDAGEEEIVEEESSEPECNSNSDCGYKEKCSSSGSCYDVDCTTDSHCSGCKRCSSNSCVSCGYGPYGCTC